MEEETTLSNLRRNGMERLRNTITWPEPRHDALPTAYETFSGMLLFPLLHVLRDPTLSRRRVLFACIGCGAGQHVRCIMQLFPTSWVVAVDHWRGLGDGRFNTRDGFRRFASVVRADCADVDERVVPLEGTHAEGVRTMMEQALIPDVVVVRPAYIGDGASETVRWAAANFQRAMYMGDGGEVAVFRRLLAGALPKHHLVWFGNAWLALPVPT